MLLALLPLLLPSPIPAQRPAEEPGLELETKAGEVTRVGFGEVTWSDPREKGAWILRPVGFERRREELVAPEGDRITIDLARGGQLHGAARGGTGEALRLELLAGIELSVDIAWIRRVAFPDRIPKDRATARMEAPVEGDRLVRWTGRDVDPIDGAVESFEADGIRFDANALGSRSFAWSEVAELFVEVFEEDLRDAEEAALPVAVDLVDGSRLQGGLAELAPEGCLLEIAGTRTRLPWSVVQELFVDDGSLTYLSALPKGVEVGRGAPFGDEFGMVWNHALDACVTGAPLRSGGRTYRRGIGMHAPTSVTWALEGDYAFLRASVGIDDSSLLHPAEARGSVLFRVRLDGEIAWESGVLRGGDTPQAVPALELAGKRELTLEVDPVDDFRGDRANWLRVLLVN